jgi:hypothetical protein
VIAFGGYFRYGPWPHMRCDQLHQAALQPEPMEVFTESMARARFAEAGTVESVRPTKFARESNDLQAQSETTLDEMLDVFRW